MAESDASKAPGAHWLRMLRWCSAWALGGCTLVLPLEEPADTTAEDVSAEACSASLASAYVGQAVRNSSDCTACLCEEWPAAAVDCGQDCWALIDCFFKSESKCDDPLNIAGCAQTYCPAYASELPAARRLLLGVDSCDGCP